MEWKTQSVRSSALLYWFDFPCLNAVFFGGCPMIGADPLFKPFGSWSHPTVDLTMQKRQSLSCRDCSAPALFEWGHIFFKAKRHQQKPLKHSKPVITQQSKHQTIPRPRPLRKRKGKRSLPFTPFASTPSPLKPSFPEADPQRCCFR